eukprot:CAMPEP_0204380482 /NCGR_PEP_ID=MMETSP0469-20131031/53407_1 /ASSEMBLY_ACC=CAM_ASM_000384 /TAXON_ID=2969 /ORGANISM="Oxyrrhis marina" /LENGTH=34 /DNA_ID= /DNA_START= /DNA_END= /DNA_ORIENTATION=
MSPTPVSQRDSSRGTPSAFQNAYQIPGRPPPLLS